jgi:signal transduction histidine kinase
MPGLNTPPTPRGRNGLASRLLLLILGFSSLVTLISTALQLYFDYRQDMVLIESRLDEIERGNLDSIAVSLWNVDIDHLRLQLEGLLRLPDMLALEIRESASGLQTPISLKVGNPTGGAVITRNMPLKREDDQGTRQLGTLVATASLDGVLARLMDRVAVILLSQFVKTVIVSTFIFYIVHMVVTRHITAIAGQFRTMGTDAATPALHLARRQRNDELDDLVDAFNGLNGSLRDSYAEVSRTNASLAAARALAADRTVKLEEANKELRRLAMVTAHHLQEPLRPMTICAQRIERRTSGGDAELAEWCASITEGTTHLGALLRDFQRYVAALTEEPRLGACDMGKVAARARSKILEAAEPAHHHLPQRIEIAALPCLTADERLMSQVLEELLGNALRHARPDAPAHVTVAATRRGADWEFTVADNGPGFDSSMVDRVLEVFEITRDRAPDHTGLGLPMCKAILRAHGGRIAVEASPLGGLVRFTLPADAESETT